MVSFCFCYLGKRPTNELDEVPTKDTNDFHHEPLQHTCNEEEYDEDGLSSSAVSSVASVSQIAELLSNMSSDATPRTLVNKIMSKGRFCVMHFMLFFIETILLFIF